MVTAELKCFGRRQTCCVLTVLIFDLVNVLELGPNSGGSRSVSVPINMDNEFDFYLIGNDP